MVLCLSKCRANFTFSFIFDALSYIVFQKALQLMNNKDYLRAELSKVRAVVPRRL
jgi:hypothetical protein